jgi:hypothetical protein
MCLYLSLSAIHVSESLVHHQEQRFGAVCRSWYKPVRLAVASQQPDMTWKLDIVWTVYHLVVYM